MSKGPHAWLRPLCLALWVLVGLLFYQNHKLQSALQKMEQFPPEVSAPEAEMAEEVKILINTNVIFKAALNRERLNFEECLSKLPQNEIDDFYRRHRQELKRSMER